MTPLQLLDDTGPRDVEALRVAAVAHRAPSGWLDLVADDASLHPDLHAVCVALSADGTRLRLTSTVHGLGAKGTLESLRDAGLAQLVATLHAHPPTHDARHGDGSAAAAVAVLTNLRLNGLRVALRVDVDRDTPVDAVTVLLTSVRDHLARAELVATTPLRRDHADALVSAAWTAARVTHLQLTTTGFVSWPSPPDRVDTAPLPVDGTLLDLLREGVPVPSASAGTWLTPRDGDTRGVWAAIQASRDLVELGLSLAALGAPALDLPPALGGLGQDVHPDAPADTPTLRRRDGVPALVRGLLDTAPDVSDLPAWVGLGTGRVAVIAGWLTDNVLALSTLPALARALARHGADAVLLSAWDAPFNPYDTFPALPDDALRPTADGRVAYPSTAADALSNPPARAAHVRKQAAAWLAGLDLSAYDAVVVPGWDNALLVLDNPTLRADARLVLPDFHLMTGIAAWHARFAKGKRTMDGGWWPSPRVEVHALYPRQVRAYWRAGVPLRQVHWRPYPVDTRAFGAGPDVGTADTWFAGGSHQRDWATLAAAARLHPPLAARLVTHAPGALPAPLQSRGEVRLLAFHEALANSRGVLLPLVADPRRPAGISVISLALAAGRPLIASSTSATVDHLRHGVNAVLVPPEDPRALLDAWVQLDADPGRLVALSAGATASGRVASVDAWARDLVHGAPRRVTWSNDTRGPFHPWPTHREDL